MQKTDKSIHNICIASIKRSTMKPYDFKWTKFFEKNADFKDAYPEINIDITDNELIICSTIIDKENFSILTTDKLLTIEKGEYSSGNLIGATDKRYGDFKSHKSQFTFGLVQLIDGNELRYFIETGKASMVMIYGVRTIIGTTDMTSAQVDNVAKIWTRKSLLNGLQFNQ